ncbi:NusB antitermination factor [Caloramator fervidus]|uniref:Transcription antitermination protein NusB n=1 Tax=Caloramator fervidus TaxID=29344 RepID=A0A1H5V681_9CLOT|nr:transcription antitermination factor NusB [Caloramator fervidus]SEF82241.1 NusB antitermination factor [Caloramator fervidus]
MGRKNAREKAMTLIYQMEITNYTADEIIKDFYENNEVKFSDEDIEYIKDCVYGVERNLNVIDSYIEKYSQGWKLNRIAKVDLSIMRLAIYEMLKREDVPNPVAINEAVELAKKYGTDQSPAFINGILGRVIEELD